MSPSYYLLRKQRDLLRKQREELYEEVESLTKQIEKLEGQKNATSLQYDKEKHTLNKDILHSVQHKNITDLLSLRSKYFEVKDKVLNIDRVLNNGKSNSNNNSNSTDNSNNNNNSNNN